MWVVWVIIWWNLILFLLLCPTVLLIVISTRLPLFMLHELWCIQLESIWLAEVKSIKLWDILFRYHVTVGYWSVLWWTLTVSSAPSLEKILFLFRYTVRAGMPTEFVLENYERLRCIKTKAVDVFLWLLKLTLCVLNCNI